MSDKPAPEQLMLGDLEQLARKRVRPQTLKECRGLAEAILRELGIAGAFTDGGRITVLGALLPRVAAEARSKATAAMSTAVEVEHDPDCLVAAAAEVLGLVDEEVFQLRRSEVYDDEDWDKLLKNTDNKGAKRQRELRAGIWIERRGTITIRRYTPDLLKEFAAHLLAYVAGHREELTELVRTHLEAATAPVEPPGPVLAPSAEVAVQQPGGVLDGVVVDGAATERGGVEPVGLIEREEDLVWLRDSYDDLQRRGGGGLFQIWGIAGVGKTTLARQFADSIAPATVVIRIGRRGLFEDDIRGVLSLEGHAVEGYSDDQCRTQFRTQVRRLTKVRLLVLDDVAEPGDVSDLMPRGSNVPVLITARERIHLKDPAARIRARQVRELDFIDTAGYLREQLPGVAERDVDELARLSGGHPETAAHIVHYLTSPEAVPPGELVEEFSRSAHAALAGLGEQVGVPGGLSALVEGLFTQIEKGGLAWAILGCVVWTNQVGTQALELVTAMLSTWNEANSFAAGSDGSAVTTFKINTALTQLERLGLVTRTPDSVIVSRLTSLILRDLLIDSYALPLRAYEKVTAAPPGETDSHLIRTLRGEYAATRPMGEELARDYDTNEEPPPALVCLDDYNWAFFVTLRRSDQPVRLVRMFRWTTTEMLSLDPGNRHWQTVTDLGAEYLLDVTTRYYQLSKAHYTKGWSPERIERYKEKYGPDAI